jgi:cytochrome P450
MKNRIAATIGKRNPRRKAVHPRAALHDSALLIISPEAQSECEGVNAAFKLLRQHPGLYRVACPGVKPFRAVTRHADIVSVERRNRIFAAAPRTILSSAAAEAELRRLSGKPQIIRGLTHMDEPNHSAYRALAQPWFAPAAVAEMECKLADWALELVDAIVKRGGRCDFARDVAAPFALRVITHILGIPQSHGARLRRFARGFAGAEDPAGRIADSPIETIYLAMLGFRDYFDDLVADRRTRPCGDLASAIANATVHGGPIPYYEMISYFVLIATAGHDTTAFAMSGGLHALIQHPEQLARLKCNPHLLDPAIEEILRWTSPVRHFLRTATEDTEISGTRVRAGECVALFYGSANRDETVFAEPGAFRIDRAPNPHLAFGWGPHFCLGHHLARLEMRALFKELLRRLEQVELAGAPRRAHSAFLTGITSLPLRCRLA